MLPTWLDIQIQAEFNREQAAKAAETYHILRMQRETRSRTIKHRIVQFGAWLERIGCSLQSRYASRPSLEVSMTSVNDVRFQNC